MIRGREANIFRRQDGDFVAQLRTPITVYMQPYCTNAKESTTIPASIVDLQYQLVLFSAVSPIVTVGY